MLDFQACFIFVLSVLKIAECGFNAAYRKDTQANTTCGNPAELFFETQQGFLPVEDRVPFTCNASDPTEAYPPGNIVDGLLGTHWQSKAGDDLAFIKISFGQAFYVQSIDITFGNYRRPDAIKIEKFTDNGAGFTPWHYLVTSPASSQCRTKFGVEAFTGVLVRVDQVLCVEYSLYFPPEYNETISIRLNQVQRGDGTSDPYTPGILDWMNATAVKFSFSGLFRKFDIMATRWHHYTVREIEVTGRCHCNGHGDGNQCPFNQSSGLRACHCEGNTCGENCQQCCPLYNQLLWRAGSGAPWNNDPSAKCEPCNCHNHSDSCTYNQTVNDLGLSMGPNGTMIGGGVCVDCKHNSRGINCEKCKDFFYRPLGKNQSDIDACHACNCNANGVNDVANISFGDCVRDVSQLSAHPGKQPGDCHCKQFVEGRQCDRCRAGYYRLTQGNPQGCIDCNCHPDGTVNRSSICQGDFNGQCSCKTNVDLRDCSQCKDGFYDLQDSDIAGCKSCDCDVGGIRSGQSCDKVTGVCHCRPHVIGRTCNSTEVGFYFPDPYFIHAAKSPYKPSTSTLHVVLNIPKTGNFRLLIEYTKLDAPEVQAQATVRFINASGLPSQNVSVKFYSFILDLPQCNNCPLRIADNLPLNEGQWMVDISTVELDVNLTLDRVIAIPQEFFTALILSPEDRSNYEFICSVEGNDISSHSECLSWLFSIAMDYLNGSLACDCHPLGSNATTCVQYGGQCSCKPGVERRDCGRCKPGFYNLTENGCTPCGCNGPDKICNVTTGWCECPNNTMGRTCLPCDCNNNTNKCLRSGACQECQFNTTGEFCQHCQDGWFGDATTQQCNACACSEVGSLGPGCDRVSGVCSCKTKVTERDCSVCQDNTFGFGLAGCQDCECNSYGSASQQCSQDIGQCSCLANATGLKCTQCTQGFYGLPDMPCTECGCNVTGTVPGTVCTNDTAGRCECKTGVTGRSCDHCARFFRNFSDAGCSECSKCIQNLQHKIVNNSADINMTNVKIEELRSLTKLNEPMTEASGVLQQAEAGRKHFYARIAAGNQDYKELVTSEIPETNSSLRMLSLRAHDLSAFSEEAASNTTSLLQDLLEEKQRTLTTRQLVTSVDEVIGQVRTAVTGLHDTGTQTLADSTQAVEVTMRRNFSQHSSNISATIHLAENMSAYVEEKSRRMLSQTSVARDLAFEVAEKASSFGQIQEVWDQAHSQFVSEIDRVYNQSAEAWATIMDAKSLLEQELQMLDSTQASLTGTNRNLSETEAVLLQATSIFEAYESTVSTVSGELEIAMLRYESAQMKFGVRINQGRNLTARDRSSQSSDPYLLVSIIPDWNGDGTFNSSTQRDTVNPVFTFSDRFEFTVTLAQLNSTTLNVSVYDEDPGDEDDFLGVVLIDLSKAGDFFNNIITEWYPLQPQDLSQISSGAFTSSSGLIDTSNILEKEISKTKLEMEAAAVKLLQAQNQTFHLQAMAQQMEQIFNGSRENGVLPLMVLERYSEIHQELNSSLRLLQEAITTMNNVSEQLVAVSLAELRSNADMALQGMSALYNSTIERNLTVFNLKRTIHEANTTFLTALSSWQHIYSQFPAIQEAAARLQATATQAPDVLPPLAQAQNGFNETQLLLSHCEVKLSEIEIVLEILFSKMTFIRNTPVNRTRLINEAFTNVRNASVRLTPNPEPPINVTVREAKAIMASLPSLRNRLENQMDNVTGKLNQMSHAATSLSLALRLVNESSVVLALSTRTIGSPAANEVSFDIRTNDTEGVVFYVVGRPPNGTNERSDWLPNSLGFIISNSTIHVVFDLGDGPITLHNPLSLTDTWHHVYFTRLGAEAVLTVSAGPDRHETVRVNATSARGGNTLQFTNESLIYIGGFPPNITESLMSSYGYYNGIIDNLVIDNHRYNLCSPKQVFGDWLFATPRYMGMFYRANGMAASFHGNGFIQHAMGQFDMSLGYAAVELEFRTLYQNGIIMAITNTDKRYIFVIYLQNGQVNFYFEAGLVDTITLTTTGSSYGDGRWYRVRAVRTSQNATLTVNLVGSMEVPDSRFVDTGDMAMESGHVITFGALQPNSVVSFVVSEVFAGDMKNLMLSSAGSASLLARPFNDHVTVSAERGVSYHGVIRGKIEYGTRFYGYLENEGDCSYANLDVDPSINSVSSLTFTFKTMELSGVLLYSANDTQGAVPLYLALFHGDLQLWLEDVPQSSSPTFVSSNVSLANNMWHVIHLNFTDVGYSLYVNNTLLHTSVSLALPLVMARPFYVGGLPRDKFPDLLNPTYFKGGMKTFMINSRSMNFFSGHSLGVSKAGVIPAIAPPPLPPIPPSCSTPLAPPTTSSGGGRVHFSLQGSGGQGYIGFVMSRQQSDFFSVSFVVGLKFRALSPDGVILYATDNDTHPTQFFSLELVHGRLRYQFNSGAGLVSMETNDRYSGNGLWYSVFFIRVNHLGAILTSTMDYANDYHAPPHGIMDLRRLYIGGVPSHVVAPYLHQKELGFSGCISDFEANSSKSVFDLNNPDLRGADSGSGGCYREAQPGLGFNGSVWARFDNFNLSADFDIQLTFRTSSRDGLLFLFMGNATGDQGEGMNVRLEQSSGQIILTYNNTVNTTRVVWTEPGIGNDSQSSYLMCQMKWHSVRVYKNGPNITVGLDEFPTVSSLVQYGAAMNGKLFLGGHPAINMLGGNHTVSTGLKGCLRSFSLDGNLLHFAQAADLAHVTSACPLNNN